MENGIHHYDDSSQVPENIKKYWHQRYLIFSEYDAGIQMTDDAWFGITPEPVARRIADHVAKAAPAEKKILIDTFAGAGGNAIAFALSGRWDQIFAIEKDPQVLQCAKHNASIYGVESKIWWIEGDCFGIMKTRLKSTAKNAVIFASPPWGGPGYTEDAIFNLNTMQPYGLPDLYDAFVKPAKDVVLYLPRTSDLRQLAKYVPDGKTLQIMHYCMKGASKALCVFYGDFANVKTAIDY
ncbi:S-adenosyl-L-methionine-dependent methyltransferase [Trichodelitschia bisporula]|uniref:Trimethylguanosine synthase n=1 Tax=Trichodelitschia bisporula TaxID=703511 RepID=A0A6G1HVE8_9PEZI|nr:S-adenosyl-L-methionine-dependent methyltransferase [Trichodelitschia bisporula]